MPLRALAVGIALLLVCGAPRAQDFTFDASEFEKKPFELGGYIELKLQHYQLNQDSTLYKLGFYNQPRDSLDQTT
ncbi:MAG: hypothetical protein H6R21_2350, partial [Proteobacteria bacterium]|nr:hypothetical protein [Pseudomonadota bacterium]